MSKTTKEERIQEGIKRLKKLKDMGMLYHVPIQALEKKGDIGIFENQGGFAKSVYYEMRLNSGDGDRYDNMCETIDFFEKETNATVYLILVNHTEFGELWTFMYVPEDKGMWGKDMKDLESKQAFVYCHVPDAAYMSEYGSIAFEFDKFFGGIYRTA